MPRRDLIVIGASAGGVEALQTVVSGLPADLPAAVVVVLHVPSHARSELPSILSRVSRLPVAHACADQPLTPGTIAIAPPDRHLTVRGAELHVSRGPRVHGHRPAIDPLFETAAHEAGRRVVGVILSGSLYDGAAGMQAIKRGGGVTVVQDPADALHPGMPRSVLERVNVDQVLLAAAIADALAEVVETEIPDEMAPNAT